MRKFIPITLTSKNRTQPPVVCLYEMNQAQRKLFDAIPRALEASGEIGLAEASHMVEQVVVALLRGRKPPKGAHQAFHDLEAAFPPLEPKTIRAMPVMGCPDGRVDGLILKYRNESEGIERAVRYDFKGGQRKWFNDHLRRLVIVEGKPRDLAWALLKGYVERLLGGAVVRGDLDFTALVASEHFKPLTTEEILALPLATDADVRELSFRDQHR